MDVAAGDGVADPEQTVASARVRDQGLRPAGEQRRDVGLEVDVDNFNHEDRRRHAQASYQAFLAEPAGGTRRWSNPATGNHGTTTITGEYRNAESAPCKRFTRNTIVNDQTYITDGTACQQPDGTWAVGELRPRNDGQPVTTN